MNDAEHDDALADEFVIAWVAETMVEAQIAEASLQASDIPCTLEDYSLNPYDGVWVHHHGWGRIRVRQADLDRARDIIGAALAGDVNCDADGPEAESET